MDFQRYGQLLNEVLKVCDPLGFRLAGSLIRRSKHRHRSFAQVSLIIAKICMQWMKRFYENR